MAKSTVLEKGLGLLSLFTRYDSPISIAELSTSANLSTSTVYRYLATLKAQGYIKADVKPGHYRLGLKILELAQAIKRETSISLSLPVMENLASQTGESVLLCARWGEK
ncbi:HTH domain-containing protein, partial [archaeon]